MTRVSIVRSNTGSVNEGWPVTRYRTLLEVGLSRLLRVDDTSAAVRSLIPSGAVAMKTNCVAGRFNSTAVALATALGDLLEDTGRRAHEIVVWDRTSRELREAGFDLNASSFGRQCLGTDAHPLQYGSTFYSNGDVSSLVSAILTDSVENSVNMPVLKDHSIVGLSCGLKNMYGAINNPNKYHGGNGDPYVAHVNLLEPIRATQRLTVIDAVRVQYHNGPGYSPGFMAYYGGLIIASDPVAADAIGLHIVDNLRKQNKLPSLAEAGRPAKYLQTAAALGLGVADISQIQFDVVTVDDKGKVSLGALL